LQGSFASPKPLCNFRFPFYSWGRRFFPNISSLRDEFLDTSWEINGWNPQITNLDRKMIFQTSMILFHINLRGCSFGANLGWNNEVSWTAFLRVVGIESFQQNKKRNIRRVYPSEG